MRRYREDGERIVRLQSGTYVRRPQAVPFRVTLADHLKDALEIVLGVIVLLAFFIGIPWFGYLVLKP